MSKWITNQQDHSIKSNFLWKFSVDIMVSNGEKIDLKKSFEILLKS